MTKCDVCGEKEQTLGGFISWDDGGKRSISRTCDECHQLSFEDAMLRQQKTLSCITFADVCMRYD
jgi:hypothetical protein